MEMAFKTLKNIIDILIEILNHVLGLLSFMHLKIA